jgi:NADPH:quinone reductase-like Zn-dependent oxidoreductase
MLIKLARTKGIESISIVRKQEHADLLKKEFGVNHVFLQDSPTCMDDFKKVAGDLKPKVFFDYIGGGSPIIVQIFESLQRGGVMTVFSCLSGQPTASINLLHMLINDKTVNSFVTYPWVCKISDERRANAFKLVADDLAHNGGKIFGTKFTKEMPLENWKDALN